MTPALIRMRLFLPIAAVVIVALCAWRMSRPPRQFRPEDVSPAARGALPMVDFLLLDQHSHPVKLDRYAGRQAVLLRFTGETPAQNDPVLVWLRDRFAEVKSAGFEAVGVTLQTPLQVREEAGSGGLEWPFPVVSDIVIGDPEPAPLHRRWGLSDSATDRPREGLFEIDRAGRVATRGGQPVEVKEPLTWLEERVGGR